MPRSVASGVAHSGCLPPRRRQRVACDDCFVPLHVEAVGAEDAAIALLIHPTSGVGADMLVLGRPGYRAIAPDRRNYGQSPSSPAGGSGRSMGQVSDVAMLQEDAEEIATLLGNGGHLFGYSYGGVVALMVASRHPQLVRTLALVEPPALQLAYTDPSVAATRRRFTTALFETIHDDPRAYFRAFLACVGEQRAEIADAAPLDRVLASMREQVPWDVDLDLDAIAAHNVPTVVFCGDWDPGFTAVARHITEHVGGRLVEYPGAGHSFAERWGDIATELARFWRAHEEC